MSMRFTSHLGNFRDKWMFVSSLFLLLHFTIGLGLVMMLNGKWLNHALTPVFQYLGMFKLIWPEQPLGAIQFITTKSLFAFAHQDPRSGLNLWTLEYDSITTIIYVLVSAMLGWITVKVLTAVDPRTPKTALTLGVLGAIFLSFSVSYITVIDHCSGATWAGFVMMYGMGFDEFQLYPAYQFISAIIGILGLAVGLMLIKSRGTTGQA